ncbi:MAG: hypothetical protein EAZ91_14425 [Cytophagales bacterium]|nr:MAG: hypothetical protein EAZ91_14425 [Cytophagales bacterium]
MKTATHKILGFITVFGIFLTLHQCTPPSEDPSIEFLFRDLRNLKMPEPNLRLATPTVVTSATVVSSTLAAAVTNGIAGIPGSGQVPAVVSQAVADANAAFGDAGISPSTIIAGFTPEAITTLTNSGQLPGSLQGPINNLRANNRLRPYFPVSSLPQVNGQPVTPTTTTLPTPTPPAIIPAVVLTPVNYNGSDACFKEANDLFDNVTRDLNASRVSQIASVNGTYNTDKSSADNEVTSCAAGTQQTYSLLVAAAKSALDASLANLQAAQPTLGSANYTTLLALTYVQYANLILTYNDLQKAELNACVVTRDARIAAAVVARDTNISQINEAFNNTVRTAQALVLQLLDSCHNQGSGR